MQEGSPSAPADFQWTCSDNSFTFNFLPEAAQFVPVTTMNTAELHPGQSDELEQDTGFAFNFQIPKSTTETSDGDLKAETTTNGADSAAASQTSAPNADLKHKPKKKKKKKAATEDKGPRKNPNTTLEEAPKQESVEMTAEEQLNRELDWCIEQIELGLRTQKSSTKQREEAARALKTLRSSKAPVAKKRQVMRAVSGDYRKKMEEERARQFRLINSAMASVKLSSASQPSRKPVFHRKAETQTCKTNKAETCDSPPPAEQPSKFLFKPSGQEFCFNFDV